MMESRIFTGKTVEEALSKALQEMRALREEVDIEVLSEPKGGIFGILGGQEAAIRVGRKEQLSKNLIALGFLEALCREMGVDPVVEVEELGGYTHLRMTGPGLGILIGRRGETLDALQYLVNLAVSRQIGEKPHIVLDAAGYREKRRETLVRLAENLARKVQKTRQPVALEPMNPQERRIIHTAIQKVPRVDTRSEGEEPYRKVVIQYRSDKTQ